MEQVVFIHFPTPLSTFRIYLWGWDSKVLAWRGIGCKVFDHEESENGTEGAVLENFSGFAKKV